LDLEEKWPVPGRHSRAAVQAGVPRFSTHTTRHLCLTDLARMGWELHAIAAFAGHRSTDSTLTYIHLSGRDLADRLNRGWIRSTAGGWRCCPARATRPRPGPDDHRGSGRPGGVGDPDLAVACGPEPLPAAGRADRG
jgi:Phage integrase family